MTSNIRAAFVVTCAVWSSPALAGTDPVVVPPSPPVFITPTVVDTQAVVTVFSVIAATTPEAAQALATLQAAQPGSVEAMTAVDTLAGAVVTSLSSSAASLPVFSPAQATEAIGLIDASIAVLTEAGVSTSGLQALKTAVRNRTGQAG